MVSMSTTPMPTSEPAGAGELLFSKQQQQQPPVLPTPPMAIPPGGGGGGGAAASAAAAAAAAEEAGRKVRKPYTITKSRESWTEPEHDKFLEALQLFDRDWKKIEAYVGSKTVIQIRSHAQKYFLKVQKNGTGEHLPPPRPKRKAAHPYPQKASKNVSQAVIPQQPSSSLMEQGYPLPMETSAAIRNSAASVAVPSWETGFVQPVTASHTQDETGAGAVAANNCSSSTESPSGTWLTSEATEQDNPLPSFRVMPDFAQVYSFLGSVFDPSTSGHLQKLKEMDPIDVETVLLLMRNLSMNLTSPDFEAHRRLLSAYGSGTEQVKSESSTKLLGSTQSLHVPFMVTSE